MNVIIYGIVRGTSKKSGNRYCAIHCLDLDSKFSGLVGNITKMYFIDEKIVLDSYVGKKAKLEFTDRNGKAVISRIVIGN